MIYDDENQLITNYVAGSWMSAFVYDGRMRRRIERDYRWNGSSWTPTNETRFIYDSNVILQHRDANNLPIQTLTRGSDLSGGFQGAGGIGGLLAMTENSSTHSFYHADGNGNVTSLINTNQFIVAKAQYDPFGNFLSLSGPKAGANCYWFSSKPIHWQSGKYDFAYRWYSPALQRWINRDPDEEGNGINLYRLTSNDSINLVDALGLKEVVLRYDLAADGISPFGVNKVASFEAILSAVKSHLEKCDCIKLLQIGAHGTPGHINRNVPGGLDINGDTFANYERANKDPRRLKIKNIKEDYDSVVALKSISALMCKGGKVEFISCSSFAGRDGCLLRNNFEGVFGKANVIGYLNSVRWGYFGGVSEGRGK